MERLTKIGKLPVYSASEVSSSRLGIGFEKLDRDVFDPNKAYDKVAAIGVKKIRLQSGWMKTERTEGVYDFAWLDEIVDKLLSLGLEPWLCLCYGNPIYTELAKPVFGAVGCPPIGSDRELQAWLRYVRATVEHFRGRISLYEIWNEPNCTYSWRHEENEEIDFVRNAREYGVFATHTAKAIKEADANAKAMGFALSRIANLQYVNCALSTGLYEVIDYISFHVYSSFDGEREANIKALRALVDSYNPNIKLIQGESGVQSRSDGHGGMWGFAWSPERQTKMLLRTMITDLYSGLEFTSYFSAMDMVEALRGRLSDKASYMDFGYFGVISAEFDEDGRATGTYTEKPSYYALQTLASLLRGNARPCAIPYAREYLSSRRVNGVDCEDTSLKVYGFELNDGKKAMLYWNCVPILTATYEGTVSFCVYGQKNDSIRICDLRDGSLYSLPDDMIEDMQDGGVRLKNLPLTDSPLAILFE